MSRKSFAEILKENLTQDSFKPPTPPPPSKQIFNIHGDINNPFLLEIKRFFISMANIDKIYGSRNFYKSLFRDQVKRIFYWCEEDFQGSLFVIYYYKNKYIYTRGYFGSCEVCDGFPDTEESLLKEFTGLKISDTIEDIDIHGYNPEFTHPELVKDFEKFKKRQTKKLNVQKKDIIVKTNPKEHQIDTSKPEHKITSWASLFK